jgi:hypothetical protein
MLGKPKLPFFVEDPKRLDIEFYSGYDECFISRKTHILEILLNDDELATRLLMPNPGEDHERLRHGLAAELLFAECHQFESFFSMLVAPFQRVPHWICLSTYSTGEIRKQVRHFIDGDYAAASNGVATDRDSFIRCALYGGIEVEHTMLKPSCENVGWLVHRMANKFIRADEYNSYKHGLRMMSTTSTFSMSVTSTAPSKAAVFSSPNSIKHLKLNPTVDGTDVSIETKQFNPDESGAHVRFMANVLASMKRSRLAQLTGAVQAEVFLLTDLDRQALTKLATHQVWRFPA